MHATTELDNLECSVLSNVAGSRDKSTLALDSLVHMLKHLDDVVDSTVTGSLWSYEGTTPGERLTGKDTGELVAETLVLAEHVTNLQSSGTNVTSWNISVLTDVLRKLSHERLAEATDLAVAALLWAEVTTTLTTAKLQASQGVLENLLETKELQDRKVDGLVKTETTLVWTESRVELDSETVVDLNFAVVVLPWNTELNKTLRDLDDLEGLLVLWLLLEERSKGRLDLVESLLEFWFSWWCLNGD